MRVSMSRDLHDLPHQVDINVYAASLFLSSLLTIDPDDRQHLLDGVNNKLGLIKLNHMTAFFRNYQLSIW